MSTHRERKVAKAPPDRHDRLLVGAMDSPQIVALIDKEIAWCLENPANNLSKEFQKGFVAGLNQAKKLIIAGENAIKKDLDSALARFIGA